MSLLFLPSNMNELALRSIETVSGVRLGPGTPLREALDLDDALITLKITPNRADCLSLLGIARDVAAITGAPLVEPSWTDARVESGAVQRVTIDDPVACPRFASRVIEGVNALRGALINHKAIYLPYNCQAPAQ